MEKVIIFQGEALPSATFWLELIGSIVPKLPEDAKDWALDLHYSVGKKRVADSCKIIKYCSEIKDAIAENTDVILSELAERLPEFNPQEMILDWTNAIERIQVIAGQTEKCEWYIPATEADLCNAPSALVFLLREFEKAQSCNAEQKLEIQNLVELISSGTKLEAMGALHKALDVLGGRKWGTGRSSFS